MFDTVCTLPLASDLFTLAIHPSSPLIATGLATGHVSVLRLPPSDSLSSTIDTQWSTRRHKLSCRSLAFSPDGEGLYSAGADGIVKYAPTATGQVTDKIALPDADEDDAPCLLHPLSDRTLLLATDSGALHLYDLRQSGGWAKRSPQQTLRPHTDYVSSLTPLPPTKESTSGVSKQWVTTGGTTLAVSDLRRGVLVRSEDQEEVLLSSVAVQGLGQRGTSVGEKVLVGGGGGVLTLWERGQWDDQDERITVDKTGGESLDCLVEVPEGVGEGKIVAVGMGDGKVRFVRLGMNKVVGQVRHDDVEGVVGMGFDAEGRLITGGGSTIKVWHEKVDEDNGAYVEEGQRPGMKFSIHDDDSDSEDEKKPAAARRDDSDSEDEGRRKKKRKGGNGGHLNGTAGNFSFAGLD